MEKVKGVTPSKAEQEATSKKSAAPTPPPQPGKGRETSVATVPTRPFSSPLPFFQMGYKKKIVVLDFENKTTYKDEMIGEAMAKKISDKLEATQRVVVFDGIVLTERLNKEGLTFNVISDSPAMKQAHRLLGIQAYVSGMVTDVSLLSSKKSEESEEEVAFATAKIEVRLVDASTGNLLKTFIGRSPIFGTRESGENSRGKAVMKALDSGIEDVMEGFLRYLDLLEWSTSIAKMEGDSLYLNAGRMSGIRVGDTLKVYEPRKRDHSPDNKPFSRLDYRKTEGSDPRQRPLRGRRRCREDCPGAGIRPERRGKIGVEIGRVPHPVFSGKPIPEDRDTSHRFFHTP